MSSELGSRLENLHAWLIRADIPFRKDFPLAKLSQIKCGGVPKLLVMPHNIIQLQELIKHLDEQCIPRFVIGNLSNLLVRSGPIQTVIVSLKNMREIIFGDGDVRVDAGVLIPTFARLMNEKGYSGYAGLYGVPASVGGAIFMNASCYGDEISRYLIEVVCLDEHGQLCTLRKNDLGFDWRYSIFHGALRRYTIVGARFALIFNPEGVKERLQASEAEVNRRTYQERENPNLGSLFATRNIYGALAARFRVYHLLFVCIRLIARLMRGDVHRNAAILSIALTRWYFHIKDTPFVGLSPKTINCVINLGGADADDIIKFVKQVRSKMQDCLPFEIEILDQII